jgi:RNA polymerase sigma factor (sigma-70 family)
VLNDVNTIACLKEGNPAAFKGLFYEYHERIYAYVLKKTNSPYIAEETLQVTFLKIWKHRSSLNEELPLFTQVFRVVHTSMIDVIRQQKRKPVSLDSSLVDPWVPANGDALTEANEFRQRLAAMIGKMPAVQKRVFEMHRFEGKSYNDIARSLAISVRTVETHISRSLRFLRKNLLLFAFLISCRYFF